MSTANAVMAQPAPIEAYATLPAIESVSISPDGASLAYIRRISDTTSSVVAQSRTGEMLVSIDVSDRTARGVFWASPDHVAIYSTVVEDLTGFLGGRQTLAQIDIVNVRTHRVARALRTADRSVLTGTFGHWAGLHRGQPVLYMQTLTTEDPARYTMDVYRVDLDDGRGRRHQIGAEDVYDYVGLRDGTIVARASYDSVTGVWRLSASRSGNWREIMSRRDLLDRPSLLGLGRTPDTVLVSEDTDDGPKLLEISLTDGSVVEELPNDGVADVLRDNNGLLIGLSREELTQSYTLFDPDLQAVWDRLQQGLPGRQIFLRSASDDQKVIVFRTEGAGEPGATYVYDGVAGSVSLVGREYPDLKPADVSQVSVVRYTAGDGRELFGYLTRPAGGARNLPLVLMPHGGPAARDHAGFDYWAQAMASRGYAVFQPQFRGSEGFGSELLEAGYGEWGRKMQSDLSDAVRYLGERGVIDRDRVCIVGASYGGYAALAGMTIDSGVYRCAVSVAGVSDLPLMLTRDLQQGGRARYNSSLRYWQRFMGAENPRDPILAELSPSRMADRIQGPVLLIHGQADLVVPFEQSRVMARAMREAGKDVSLVELEGEDHYMTYPATRRRMLTETIAFLERHNPAR